MVFIFNPIRFVILEISDMFHFLAISDSRGCDFQFHDIWVYFESEFHARFKSKKIFYVRLYDSYWICPCFPNNSYLRRHHSTRNFTLIPILKPKNISAYALKRKSSLKKIALADPKNFLWFQSGVKFGFEIYPYFMKLKITTSRIADGQKIEHVRYL